MSGFLAGEGLSAGNKARLDAFVADLGAKKVNLFKGPLNFQDGSVFLKEGQEATDEQVSTPAAAAAGHGRTVQRQVR